MSCCNCSIQHNIDGKQNQLDLVRMMPLLSNDRIFHILQRIFIFYSKLNRICCFAAPSSQKFLTDWEKWLTDNCWLGSSWISNVGTIVVEVFDTLKHVLTSHIDNDIACWLSIFSNKACWLVSTAALSRSIIQAVWIWSTLTCPTAGCKIWLNIMLILESDLKK